MPQTQRTRIIPLAGTPPFREQTAPAIAALSPLKWLSMNELAGTTVINRGSVTGDGTWTVGGGGAIGQPGQLGPKDAYLFDSAASRIAVALDDAFVNIPAWTYAALVRPTSGGEGNTGRLWDIGAFRRYVAALTANYATIQSIVRSTANAATNTTNGLTLNRWQWVFETYDDGGERLIRLYKGMDGVVTEFSYAVHTAATGTITTETEEFSVGNNTVQNATFAGLYDEFYVVSGIQSAASMLNIVKASGV